MGPGLDIIGQIEGVQLLDDGVLAHPSVGARDPLKLIIDVSAMDVMDSFAARTLSDIANMIRLRGAETVIVGIQPEVAFSMVQLGLKLEGVATALDLEEGLDYLDHKTRRINRGPNYPTR